MSEEDISEALEISIEEAAPILARALAIVSNAESDDTND